MSPNDRFAMCIKYIIILFIIINAVILFFSMLLHISKQLHVIDDFSDLYIFFDNVSEMGKIITGKIKGHTQLKPGMQYVTFLYSI